MLLPPQFQKRNRQPAPMRLELMDHGMAGGADRDKPLDFVHARPTVVDGPLIPCPTPLALVTVAREHLVADAGEIKPGVPAAGVAGGAKSGYGRRAAALGAKQGFLAQNGHGAIIASDKEHYH